MKVEGDDLIFDTGKRLSANFGIIGLGRCQDGTLEVSEGYDDGFNPEDFTPEERRELADYMIALWTEYRGNS